MARRDDLATEHAEVCARRPHELPQDVWAQDIRVGPGPEGLDCSFSDRPSPIGTPVNLPIRPKKCQSWWDIEVFQHSYRESKAHRKVYYTFGGNV